MGTRLRLGVVKEATWQVSKVGHTPYIRLRVIPNRPVYISRRKLVKVYVSYPLIVPLGLYTKSPMQSLEEAVGRIKTPTNKEGDILIEDGKTIPELIGKAVAVSVGKREYNGTMHPYAQLVKVPLEGAV